MEIEVVKLRDLHAHLLATDKAYAEAAREVDAAQSLADRVVALRVGAGLTQAQLAKKAGISQPRLSKLESGVDNPTLDTLERVGDALGVRLDYTSAQMSLPLLTVSVGSAADTGPLATTGNGILTAAETQKMPASSMNSITTAAMDFLYAEAAFAAYADAA